MTQGFFIFGPIPSDAIQGTYDFSLVALSYLIAVLASYVALDLAGRVRVEKKPLFWLLGGAFAMGAGIWAMHFIGMLAFIMPMTMQYNLFWTVLSLLVAISASGLALDLLKSKHFTRTALIYGGILIGVAIVTMHYLGMQGMEGHVRIRYLPGLFLLSIGIAIVAAMAALWLANQSSQGTNRKQIAFKTISALVMGAAICGMHYTGMAAAIFTPLPHMMMTETSLIPSTLAFSIAGIVGGILLIALVASAFKQSLMSAVQNEKNFLNAILDNMDNGIIACDSKGKINLINHSLQEKYNLKKLPQYAKDLSNYLDFRTVAENQTIDNKYNPLLEALTKPIRSSHFTITTPNNGARQVVINGQPITNAAGKKLGAVIVIHDITERARMEQMKNEFISTVSHELRTPLTSIRGSLGLILGGAVGEQNEKTQGLIQIAHSNCERLIRLINDILDIEKIEAGKMTFNMQPTPLPNVINHAIEINQGLSEKTQIAIKLQGKIPDVQVNIDQDRLTQVITNLISNAVKFSPPESSVDIEVKMQDQQIEISVSDRGKGIPEEFKSHMFGKFAQADSSSMRKQGGTGLGLSISKAIIEKMGGTINFTTQQNVGTTFYFTLPIWHETLNVTRKVKVAPRILICEDDRDIASLLDIILTNNGFNVDTAYTLSEAKEKLANKNYDALTLDLIFPDGDGISLVQSLRKDNKFDKLPIIIISGKIGNKKKLLNGDAINIIDWLYKPVDAKQLNSAIQNIKQKLKPKKPYLLHIEDDSDLSKVIAKMLHDEVEMKSASTLHEAKKFLDSEKFDIVLLDLILPDGSGTELLPFLCRQHIPVIVFSAFELPNDYIKYVTSALTKSRTTDYDLLNAIKAAINKIGDTHVEA